MMTAGVFFSCSTCLMAHCSIMTIFKTKWVEFTKAHAVHMLNYDDIPDKMGRIHQASLCPPGPKELGEYLLKLDKDDDLYNQYFQVN